MYGRTVPQRVHHVGLSVACLSNFNPPAEPPPLTTTIPNSCTVTSFDEVLQQQRSAAVPRRGEGRASNGFFQGTSQPAKGQKAEAKLKGWPLPVFPGGPCPVIWEISERTDIYSLFIIFLGDFRELCIWLRVLVARSMISTFRCTTIELQLVFIQSCVYGRTMHILDKYKYVK